MACNRGKADSKTVANILVVDTYWIYIHVIYMVE